MKRILVTLIFLGVTLAAWSQPFQRNQFTTNVPPLPVLGAVNFSNTVTAPTLISRSDIRFWGAVDGAADNTAAISNALANVDDVYIPGRTSVWNTLGLTLRSNQRFHGDGGTIKFKTGGTGWLIDGQNATNVTIEGLTFDGGQPLNYRTNSTGGTRNGLVASACGLNVLNCLFTGLSGTAMLLNDSGGYNFRTAANISDTRFLSNYTGFMSQNEYDRLVNCSATYSYNGFELLNGNQEIQDSTASECHTAILVAGAVGNNGHGSVEGCQINHCDETIKCLGLNFDEHISGNIAWGGVSVIVSNCSGVFINGNTFGIGVSELHLGGGPTASNYFICGNFFDSHPTYETNYGGTAAPIVRALNSYGDGLPDTNDIAAVGTNYFKVNGALDVTGNTQVGKELFRDATASYLRVAGGASAAAGANVVLYANDHATLPNQMHLFGPGGITLHNSLIFDQEAYRGIATGFLRISGGAAAGDTPNITLYGNSHASLPGQIWFLAPGGTTFTSPITVNSGAAAQDSLFRSTGTFSRLKILNNAGYGSTFITYGTGQGGTFLGYPFASMTLWTQNSTNALIFGNELNEPVAFIVNNAIQMTLSSAGLSVEGAAAADTITGTNGVYLYAPTNGVAPPTTVYQPLGFFGSMMMTGVTNTVTVSAQNTYYVVTNFQTLRTNQFIADGKTGFLTNLVAGYYRIMYYLAMTTGTSDLMESELQVNGVGREEVSSFSMEDNPARIKTITVNGVLYLPANSYVCVTVNNRTAAANINIWRGGFTIGTP